VVLAVLALALCGAPGRGDAANRRRAAQVRGPSVAPLFDTHRRFRKGKEVKLRFRIDGKSFGPLAAEDVSFAVTHRGPPATTFHLRPHETRPGVFEVPFAPQEPGLYTVVASIRGKPANAARPVRLGVLGMMPGIVEQPPEADLVVQQRKRMQAKAMR
jgi:hypothetical protein